MKQNTKISSLLPYLESTKEKFYLRFPLIPQKTPIQEKSHSPFLTINESAPFTRLIEAQFVTDAGSEIKRVFVLLQKDEYLFANDELRPINNKDVDEWWQRAFSFYSGTDQDDSVIVLADQLNREGGFSPLQSLCFCKLKHIFFHPPCFKCGYSLQQCYNDNLLISVGLKPYSTSLERYLFCPSCFALEEGKPDFYVFASESSDPGMLKDRCDMMREFGLMTEDKDHLRQFPCIECPNHQECYGSDGLVVSRVVPFSFYPFYMLIFEAMSVNTPDFLSLVSGASFEDIETKLSEKQELGRLQCLKALKRNSRAKTLFFFDRGERYFLEILYLKLSFLGELVHTLFSGLDMFNYPDMWLSIDRIWVKFTDQGGLLPYFWNFKVRIIDVMENIAEAPSLPKLPPSYGLHFLGHVWFYTLLVNKKQGISNVHTALKEAIEHATSFGDALFKSLLERGAKQTFFPENIFWDPDVRAVREDWRLLWEESLDLGWSLFKVSLNGDSQWSKEEFWQKIESLREDVKENLFPQKTSVSKTEPFIEDRAIYDILVKIKDKWQTEIAHEKDDLEGTVIITPDTREVLDETVVTTIKGREALDETVVFSLQDKAVIRPQEGDEVQETMIISSEHLGKGPPPERVKEDEIPETVIISPQEKSRIFSEPQQQIPPKDISYEKKEKPLKQKIDRFDDSKKTIDEPTKDDFLTETIILSPDKDKEKH